ncbi:hypothetical protein OGH69_04750 [Flavobacterium sp. MFBS3-15]|uniref:hypothetical protein n=1 Tax=Flavobacterium sp. MFBS3-15 TaxID=2989816 RepID=UPI002236A740|nr:hypothetical protein [Flavobacterium sp. MFBS3-15]MCW4468267.1 hypothetical protein [Flavobacterium sp. MFBS3-15]
MKRKTLLTLAATGLVLLTSCGPQVHRYGCNRRRCIVQNETKEKTPLPAAGQIAKKVKATV